VLAAACFTRVSELQPSAVPAGVVFAFSPATERAWHSCRDSSCSHDTPPPHAFVSCALPSRQGCASRLRLVHSWVDVALVRVHAPGNRVRLLQRLPSLRTSPLRRSNPSLLGSFPAPSLLSREQHLLIFGWILLAVCALSLSVFLHPSTPSPSRPRDRSNLTPATTGDLLT
jgi:hypothetical protein